MIATREMGTLLLELALALATLQSTLTQAQAQQAPTVYEPPISTAPIEATTTLPFSYRYKNVTISQENVWQVLDKLSECESRGIRGAYNPKDVDGLPAFGEFQYKKGTWEAWEKESGITGDPMERADAIKMTHWALLTGKGNHWGCFQKATEFLR